QGRLLAETPRTAPAAARNTFRHPRISDQPGAGLSRPDRRGHRIAAEDDRCPWRHVRLHRDRSQPEPGPATPALWRTGQAGGCAWLALRATPFGLAAANAAVNQHAVSARHTASS